MELYLLFIALFMPICSGFINLQLKGSVKEPNKFHNYETEKITWSQWRGRIYGVVWFFHRSSRHCISCAYLYLYLHFCCSSNRITTLANLAYCSNLEELYLRNNSVSIVGELVHLKGLGRLRVLWLDGNPCTKDPAYRRSVLRMLPKLHRLDNTGCVLICANDYISGEP